MFDDKKLAEEHDKMLELAANITHLLEGRFPKLDDNLAEDIGILMASNKETLLKAFKGRPELILDIGKADTEQSAE